MTFLYDEILSPYIDITPISWEKISGVEDLNQILEEKTGIIQFFATENSIQEFVDYVSNTEIEKTGKEKVLDLGDFQTPDSLCNNICKLLKLRDLSPEFLIEPTCGRGSFVIAGLKMFPSIKYVYAIEIQPNYEWAFKYQILQLSQSMQIDAKIEFHRDNIFTHNFDNLFSKIEESNADYLLLGNPPWITNSELETIQSTNLPKKRNLKKMKGIDSLTGKSNFDLAESILLTLIQKFSRYKGHLAMLCKNIVVKNLMKESKRLSLRIAENQAFMIDAKKEFKANVSAVLFYSKLGWESSLSCISSDFYSNNLECFTHFGWVGEKFVSNIEKYRQYSYLDGFSSQIWRQGVKHDLTNVMVLTKVSSTESGNDLYQNGLEETIELENKFVYPFLKSSQVKNGIINEVALNVILTQKIIGEPTDHIELESPKLWDYLNSHIELFNKRKSKIYENAPPFSIFGIGPYAFLPYKIGISGFYKDIRFTLILPINNKAVMLDDTCYFLSFDSLASALIIWTVLNLVEVKEFLNSIIFSDEKRPVTKDILMRLNLGYLINSSSFSELHGYFIEVLNKYNKNIPTLDFDEIELNTLRKSILDTSMQQKSPKKNRSILEFIK
jgi:hypothetical protein